MEQTTKPIVFAVDEEHDNLRIVVALIFIITAVVSYFALLVTMPGSAFNIIAIVGALLLSGMVTSLIERQLKARWPSGREVHLDSTKVVLMKQGRSQKTIELNGEAQLLKWRFKIDRRARVPRGWYMVAIAVHDMPEDDYLTTYCLISPDQYDVLDPKGQFIQLERPGNQDDQKMRLAGVQRRLHAAESFRWREGAEMTFEDFSHYLTQLEQIFYD